MSGDGVPVSSDDRQVAARWSVPERIAFRFCVLYFGAFCLVISQTLLAYTGVVSKLIPQDWLQWQLTTQFAVDGTTRPPLTTDPVRWQRLVIDVPGVVTIQRMDGSLVGARAEVSSGRVALEKPTADFTIDSQGSDAIRLAGTSNGKRITMTLHRQNLDDFPLRSTGFHWVQEFPNFG